MCVNYEQNFLKSLNILCRGGGQNSRSNFNFKIKYYFSANIKVGTSIILIFHAILTGNSISYIIFMIQGHLQGQKLNFKAK